MPKIPPTEFWSEERCYITELLNAEDCPEVSLARTRVEPGMTTELHALSVTEYYVIESGTGLMHVEGQAPRTVGPGDTVTIPKQLSQNIENTGISDLIFLCICAPRFTPDCYTSLE